LRTRARPRHHETLKQPAQHVAAAACCTTCTCCSALASGGGVRATAQETPPRTAVSGILCFFYGKAPLPTKRPERSLPRLNTRRARRHRLRRGLRSPSPSGELLTTWARRPRWAEEASKTMRRRPSI
jgi:hypothetical protein